MSDNFFLKSCTNCMLPETYETFEFDKKGVCNVCNSHKHQKSKIDWDARAETFNKLVEDFRGKGDYDCLVPFSGGKDSTYVLYEIVVKHKLKPLVISFDHGFFREQHLKNIERTLKILGTDYLTFKPNMKIVGKLMLESLKRKGDFCWHCHVGISALPINVSGIPSASKNITAIKIAAPILKKVNQCPQLIKCNSLLLYELFSLVTI